MSYLTAIEHLMLDIGPLMDLGKVAAYRGRHAWQLAFDGDTTFDAVYDPMLTRLVLSGDIGEVPERERLPIYEILLEYNAEWTISGGVRMALKGPNRRLMMFLDLPAANLEANTLADALTNLARTQSTWRKILRDVVLANEATAENEFGLS